AMTNSIDDIADDAQAFFVIGTNTTENHPVIGMRIRQAVRQRGAKLIVADPRKIDLTNFAALHLRHIPGTDIALVNGLMNIILSNGWEDNEFIKSRTEGFDDFKTVVDQYTPEIVSEITGVPVEDLQQAAEILAQNKPTAVLWAMGITQHTTGVGNVMSLANLQMLLGNMGVPGGGTNPLRGQNNVQGACDLGGLPNVYPGYQKVTSPEIRSGYAKAWGLAEEQLSLEVGLTATEMMPLAFEGKLKSIHILGEDPIMSEPDTNHIRLAMENIDFVILEEIFPSETAPYADVLLPGASFAEKDGTFTNTERRVQLVHKAVESPGIARPDWWIISELAKKILKEGKRQVGEATYSGWDYQNAAEIMDEIAALTPIYAGVNFQRLLNGETLQWPVKDLEHPGTPILHVGQFSRGKGQFNPIEHIPPAELPDKEYPMILSTGRVLYHWHGGQMTRRSKGLLEIYPESLIEVSEDDAERMGLNGSRRVRVSSRRGTIEAQAMITDRVPPGMVYANFHFPEASANELTIAALDPVAKIPEYKVCAVKVEAV
ncbi:MAG: molybdopterin-dependent oxidoreductase, partial [Anaerolineales bacterium]|nr:molybdopterin-dependent oxidoreductase [Anaerolineales bacterium]